MKQNNGKQSHNFATSSNFILFGQIYKLPHLLTNVIRACLKPLWLATKLVCYSDCLNFFTATTVANVLSLSGRWRVLRKV